MAHISSLYDGIPVVLLGVLISDEFNKVGYIISLFIVFLNIISIVVWETLCFCIPVGFFLYVRRNVVT
jgi:hypothetical protein